MSEIAQYQLKAPLTVGGGDIEIIDMHEVVIPRSAKKQREAIYGIEQIITRAYALSSQSKMASNISDKELSEEEKKRLEEEAEKADKGETLMITISSFSDDDNAISKIISNFEALVSDKKTRDKMLFVDDRPISDEEFEQIKLKDFRCLALSYIANFIKPF